MSGISAGLLGAPTAGDYVVVRSPQAPAGPTPHDRDRWAVVVWAHAVPAEPTLIDLDLSTARAVARVCAAGARCQAWDGSGALMLKLPPAPLIYSDPTGLTFTISVAIADGLQTEPSIRWRSVSNLAHRDAVTLLHEQGFPAEQAQALLAKAAQAPPPAAAEVACEALTKASAS
jgi:hypothetical protein